MKSTNGKLLQKNSLSLYQIKARRIAIEIFILSLLGILGVVLHARLRLGLGIPGHHGFIFMFLILSGRINSRLKLASTVSTFSAALFLYLPILGFKDPFMPMIYFSIGLMVDLLYVSFKNRSLFFAVIIIGGLAYLLIPFWRFILMTGFGIPYLSFRHGIILPFITHFAFGSAGAVLAYTAVKLTRKSQIK